MTPLYDLWPRKSESSFLRTVHRGLQETWLNSTTSDLRTAVPDLLYVVCHVAASILIRLVLTPRAFVPTKQAAGQLFNTKRSFSMSSQNIADVEVSKLAKDELVRLIKSEQGPWSDRVIDLQDRSTLERLGRMACRARFVRAGA